jgi:protein-disulfide isomerase
MKYVRRTALKLASIGLLAGLSLALASCNKANTGDKIADDDMTMGSATAKITLIEYASPTCSHCAEFDEKVFPAIKAKYIDTGKVHYVFREFLTPPQETAAASILLARCAGKDKYFGVLESVWRSLPEMFGTGKDNSRPVLENIALSSGLSKDDFTKCVTDPKGLARIQSNMEKYTTEYQINGTPSFFIDGKRFDYKGGGIEEFDAAFKAKLDAK